MLRLIGRGACFVELLQLLLVGLRRAADDRPQHEAADKDDTQGRLAHCFPPLRRGWGAQMRIVGVALIPGYNIRNRPGAVNRDLVVVSL